MMICKNGEKITKFRLSVPIGELELKACPRGLHELHTKRNKAFPNARTPKWDDVEISWQEEAKLDYAAKKQALDYFRVYFAPSSQSHSNLDDFLPDICWRGICTENTFSEKVMKTLLGQVGPGAKVSYSELANMAGNSKAQRAVGSVMRKNPIALIVPCHRVVRSNKTIGNYNGGVEIKEWLLEYERLYYS